MNKVSTAVYLLIAIIVLMVLFFVVAKPKVTDGYIKYLNFK